MGRNISTPSTDCGLLPPFMMVTLNFNQSATSRRTMIGIKKNSFISRSYLTFRSASVAITPSGPKKEEDGENVATRNALVPEIFFVRFIAPDMGSVPHVQKRAQNSFLESLEEVGCFYSW